MGTIDGRTARSLASKAAILAAATRIVAAEGLSALTHRAVATTAGVSHALVTYHFDTALALRAATFTHAVGRLIGGLEELLVELPDPADIPRVGTALALRMTTDLRDETLTTYELMLAASRNPELRPLAEGLTEQVADLLEPAARNRERAVSASTTLLGSVLASMATGADRDQAAFQAAITTLIDRFAPKR